MTILSLMYFTQVFIDGSSSIAFWIVSLLSPTGVALAMDKVSNILYSLFGQSIVTTLEFYRH